METGGGNQQKNRHFLGLMAGMGTGVVAGLIMAGVGALLKEESMLVVVLCLALVGFVVSRLVPNKSAMGAITGGLSCLVAVLAYLFFLSIFAYSYEDSSSIWKTLAIGVFYGGYMGYKGKKGFESEE